MIRRPLTPRFNQAVLTGRKFTTIRSRPWPVGVPIMLYNWTGPAYRSKQADVASVIVTGFWPILIAQMDCGRMRYSYGMENSRPLHETEGFDSRDQLDEWFRKLCPPGDIIVRSLMRFRLANPSAIHIPTPLAC